MGRISEVLLQEVQPAKLIEMFPFYDERAEARRQAVLRLIRAGLIGGVPSSIAYVVYGLAVEFFILPGILVSGQPYLSYGQEAMMLMCVAGILGACFGASFVIARFGEAWWSP